MTRSLKSSVRLGSSVLFFFLEFVCIFLAVEFNQGKKQTFLHSAGLLGGLFMEGVQYLENLALHQSEMERLQDENADLKTQLTNLRLAYTRLPGAPGNDSTVTEKYRFIPASVINKNVIGHNNHFTIDAGGSNGVKPHMGVISSNGIIGIVVDTSRYYAKVMTLLHSQSRISARLRTNKFHGSLIWDGKRTDQLLLRSIPKHVKVAVGDTIETSGYTNLFPPDLLIGTVDSVGPIAGEDNHFIRVHLFEDIGSTLFVYVVENKIFPPQNVDIKE